MEIQEIDQSEKIFFLEKLLVKAQEELVKQDAIIKSLRTKLRTHSITARSREWARKRAHARRHEE